MTTQFGALLSGKVDASNHPKLLAKDDDRFWTFQAPLINSIFQCQDEVWIKGLKSKGGRVLNGRKGVPLTYNLATDRYLVRVSLPKSIVKEYENDNSFDATTCTVQRWIKRGNMELKIALGVDPAIRILHEVHPSDPSPKPTNRGLEWPACAGTQNGQRALCFWPHHGTEELKSSFRMLGLPEYMYHLCLPEYEVDETVCNLCGDACDASCGGGGRCRCKMAVYCSKQCQRADWGRHKVLCKLLAKKHDLSETFRAHSERLIDVPRPDGEEVIFTTPEGIPHDPCYEFHIWAFPDGRKVPKVDTGIVILYRMDYEHQAMELSLKGCSQEELNQQALCELVGKPFYHQPGMVPTFFKLESNEDIFGERVEITEEQAVTTIKMYGGEDSRFTNFVNGRLVPPENFHADVIFDNTLKISEERIDHTRCDGILKAHGLGMLARSPVQMGNWPEWES